MNPILTLETTAYTLEQLISLAEPQIALAGRSNVGKSSLINALAGRKKLAKVSATPGKTRSVNYYKVTPYNFYLVDLPGYGYARASHSEREKWAHLLERYLVECSSLKALALLLDSRLEPQMLDKNLASFARTNGLNIVPVLTKADKCTQRERANRQNEWQELLGTRPVVTSSSNRFGIDNLWRILVETAVPQRVASGAAENAEAENEQEIRQKSENND
ncbi:MAG: YihA family ribosome biogenesis GTP-binding protein [Desulfovibrio sp.]|uniref:ribosome biogenesis GTP-binding protein YihA/YsxC n=1 Tax=Desulfovibrio sp. TaxID=885 RepID=UPI00135D62EF|nr:ribosome biogenesis GTP-binding protein YihA/YsxC [Desulfovibrio sp.]MTJ92577.1 YihA family ribosome biogenesis GTP-binding protein [Desulfovibrio sp.]